MLFAADFHCFKFVINECDWLHDKNVNILWWLYTIIKITSILSLKFDLIEVF